MWHSPVGGGIAEGCRSDTLRVFSTIKYTTTNSDYRKNTFSSANFHSFNWKFCHFCTNQMHGWIRKTNPNHSLSETTVLTLTGCLGPIFRPTKGPGMFEKPGVTHLQMWDEATRGRTVQSCPWSARYLPSWQQSCRVRGSVSAVLEQQIRKRQKRWRTGRWESMKAAHQVTGTDSVKLGLNC